MSGDETMDDPQREVFYAFERAARVLFERPDVPALSIADCRSYVERAWVYLAQRPQYPVAFITQHWDGGEGGSCTLIDLPDEAGKLLRYFVIGLSPGRRRPWCALHEAAHALYHADGHGPIFGRTCVELWVEVGGWPRVELEALATRYDVELAVPVGLTGGLGGMTCVAR